MNQQLLKRIIACLLLGALVLGLLPMFALAAESDAAMSAPTDPEELVEAADSAQEPMLEITDSEKSSIGIIGGADGPTAIFVTGNGIVSTLLLIAGGICGIIAVITILKKRKK